MTIHHRLSDLKMDFFFLNVLCMHACMYVCMSYVCVYELYVLLCLEYFYVNASFRQEMRNNTDTNCTLSVGSNIVFNFPLLQ